ncbi:MarR family transcriptional regulator [Fusibacter bizertensis]|uniref:MarR family transcriptional regulator n=1 Tax=Fusibacter bizertensis TaxID=1488331 RepID=A0ABT6NCK4_9FIRM|nr:MarR family transcriptional regulator [Fusibacter bizertensis]MDH8678149.1 MarR family transcriptional regulator [Fusibacter bizertensis]
MEVRECINFLLGASQNVVFKYFAKQLSDYGLTPSQYGVLNCLWQYGDLSPSKIREILSLEASSVSGILDRMQKSGLVDRHIDENNRRIIIVTPTEKSMEVKDDVEAVVREMNQKFLEPFSDEERIILRKALTTIIDNE